MSISSINSTTSGLAQALQMQQRPPEPPLKDQVDAMSEEDRTSFDEKISSFSKEQMMYFMSLMASNEDSISSMSQEEATAAIFELMDQAASIEDLSEVEGLEALDALADEMPPPPPHGGMPPPPPPSEEATDPLASLTQENMDTFIEMLESMSDEQKLEFGTLLMDAKEELSGLDASEAAQKVLDLLEEASQSVTNASTQSATSKFTNGGDFLDLYS
jgi:hypothetical protein